MSETKFPLIDAILTEPTDTGKTGICTNTQAPSMVLNEIPQELRKDIAVMGSLTVSRDGAERMIVNALVHPHLEYIILFAQETLSFRPSTNLLLALMHGYESKGNRIKRGMGVAHEYPSISEKVLEQFRSRFKVIPLYSHENCSPVLTEYLAWLAPKIPKELHEALKKIHAKGKFYYNNLLDIIKIIEKIPAAKVSTSSLDISDFAHLQPPVTVLTTEEEVFEAPFYVKEEKGLIALTITLNDTTYRIKGDDSFLLAYSFMMYCKEHDVLVPKELQILIGAELSRMEVHIRNDLQAEPFTLSTIEEKDDAACTSIPLQARTFLLADKKYYYKMGLRDNAVYVQSLAHDICDVVFELRAKSFAALYHKLCKEDRFAQYEQTLLHRLDVGIEVGRAIISLRSGSGYFQDFRNVFSINTEKFPLLITEADTFLTNHRAAITNLYTKGLTTTHPDTHKGTMRSGTTLAVYRNAPVCLEKMPGVYGSSSMSANEMRAAYKIQLFSPECEGTYTYGQRTRAHFGKDQLAFVEKVLKEHPEKPAIVQRFDYVTDMTITQTPVTDETGKVIRTRIEASKDPCLTHDVYFTLHGKLHAFHIARAHNVVNAYPENIFGLYDAYDCYVSEQTGIPLGDMFMLSSRSNILLLTEEQKAKKIISEPSKSPGDMDESAGPYNIGNDPSSTTKGVSFEETTLALREEKPEHPCLATLEDFNGVNIIKKAIDYLAIKGNGHNNPIIGTYDPRTGIIDTAHRLVFMQGNQRGGTFHLNAVFIGHDARDKALCEYIGSQFAQKLDLPLGNLFIFHIPGAIDTA